MNLKINNHMPSFKAQMKIYGNLAPLQKEQIESIKREVEAIGTPNDIVKIDLPVDPREVDCIYMSAKINNENEYFSVKYNNNELYSGIMEGIDKIKEFFDIKPKSAKRNDNLTKEFVTKLLNDEQFKKGIKKLVTEECDTKSKDKNFIRSILNTINNDKNFTDRYFTPIVLSGVNNRVKEHKDMWGYCDCVMGCDVAKNRPVPSRPKIY